MRSGRHGYSLIELLAVLAILSVLLLAVWPLADLTAERDRERDLKRALWEIRDALDAYKRLADEGVIEGTASGYPANLQALVDGPLDRRNGARIYLLRRLPRDPFAEDVVPAEQSWGLRSYRSPPLDMSPGLDVYDVYSKSSAMALDGTPVHLW